MQAPQNDQEAMALLEQAKEGNVEARRLVSLYVFEKFDWMTARFYSSDPAVDRDDIRSIHYIEILRGIDIVDGRGSPLYYLNQRGLWRVANEVARRGKAAREVPQDYRDVAELEPGRIRDTNHDQTDVVISRLSARQMLVKVAPLLENRERDAFEAMVTGKVGDPAEPGLNKRLAECLEVSEQRASQITARLQEVFESHT